MDGSNPRPTRGPSTCRNSARQAPFFGQCCSSCPAPPPAVLVEVHVTRHCEHVLARNDGRRVLTEQLTRLLEFVHRDETFTTHRIRPPTVKHSLTTQNVTSAPSPTNFKKHFKTHLFSRSYPKSPGVPCSDLLTYLLSCLMLVCCH